MHAMMGYGSTAIYCQEVGTLKKCKKKFIHCIVVKQYFYTLNKFMQRHSFCFTAIAFKRVRREWEGADRKKNLTPPPPFKFFASVKD